MDIYVSLFKDFMWTFGYTDGEHSIIQTEAVLHLSESMYEDINENINSIKNVYGIDEKNTSDMIDNETINYSGITRIAFVPFGIVDIVVDRASGFEFTKKM